MTNQELERRLEQALSHAAPDDLEGVLSRCEPRKGTVIPMMKKTPNRAKGSIIAACLAIAFMLIGGGGGLVYQQTYAVASVVSLDVNPSIEMTVNRNGKVLACTPLNQEAIDILSDMDGGADLKNTKLDVAVNAVVGALVRHGYLDSITSAILISVEDKDADRAAKLRQELTMTVDSVLQEQAANAAVLSQTLTQDVELKQQAKANNISTGKAYLVRQVMEMNGTLSLNSTTALNQLSALSVEELSDLLETGEMRIPIGKSVAAEAAEKYAGILSSSGVTTEVDAELDDQPAHYDVELYHPTGGEFEYQVDAFTGQVLSGPANILQLIQHTTAGSSTSTNTPSGTAATDIGADKAKTIALSHAGLSKSERTQVSGMQIKQDYDDGQLEYEVEFYLGTTEYDYTIDGVAGTVLDYTVERHSDDSNAGTGTTTDIGADKAKTAALHHAGLTETQITDLKVEADHDDGRLEYEVEFRAGNIEYEYTIDGTTAAVLKHESDLDD